MDTKIDDCVDNTAATRDEVRPIMACTFSTVDALRFLVIDAASLNV